MLPDAIFTPPLSTHTRARASHILVLAPAMVPVALDASLQLGPLKTFGSRPVYNAATLQLITLSLHPILRVTGLDGPEIRAALCRRVEAAVRSNLVIAIGDLAFRFPNQLEPWTAHMYDSLKDTDTGAS